MKKWIPQILVPLSLTLIVIGAAGCGEDEADAPVIVAKKERKPEAAPVVEAAPNEDISYAYDAVNRRDPFESYFEKAEASASTDGEPVSELQQFEIDKLKLVAVVVGTATPMAMVEDPSGAGHTVKIGTPIGKRFGQVKHIRRGEIIIQEEFRDFTGKRIPVLKPMKLMEPELKVGSE